MLPKFILIDGSSLMHRAFYALPILSSSKGEYTNAIYGFAMMLCKLVENTHPTAMAVAFDKSRITFRTKVYEGYKANRSATPTELKEQFATVQELIGSLDIPVLEIDGYEADDIIGTLSAKAEAQGYETIIVTGDRDALQLLSPTTHVMFTRKGVTEIDWYDEAVFEAKYELRPEQLIDMKGLMGDSSDNIPGVPGVGEKTALKLLKEYGSVEAVLDHVDSIKGKKLKENLLAYRDDAIMSKRLATIVRDMPIEFVPDEFAFAPEWEKVKPMLERFELRTIIGKFAPLLQTETKETKPITVTYNSDAQVAEAIAERIRKEKEMAFMLVTDGKVPLYEAVGIAVADGEDVCWWDCDADGFQTMRALLSDDSIKKITYDWKRVYHTFTETMDAEKQNIFDVMIAAYLVDATNGNYSIEELVGQYLPEY
ncbi:MAG: DNA polymerase I, partial [Selenomonadales bacterium]|nr:DNA polymerase I [Selenomonadales bacterium]